MTEKTEKAAFEGWCRLAILGHVEHIGYVSEAPMFGTTMVQIQTVDRYTGEQGKVLGKMLVAAPCDNIRHAALRQAVSQSQTPSTFPGAGALAYHHNLFRAQLAVCLPQLTACFRGAAQCYFSHTRMVMGRQWLPFMRCPDLGAVFGALRLAPVCRAHLRPRLRGQWSHLPTPAFSRALFNALWT